jgi:FMN reductase
MTSAPLIVALGGTTRANSSTEKALRIALAAAAAAGAQTLLIEGPALELPLYAPERPGRHPDAERLVDAVRRADGLLIGSPGYHGGISGMVKNALDYVEDLARDARPYLSGRAVGCIATGAGHQGAVVTLGAIRSVVHALRGWPTPLGAAINTAEPVFDAAGTCLDPRTAANLTTIGRDVVAFARVAQAMAA